MVSFFAEVNGERLILRTCHSLQCQCKDVTRVNPFGSSCDPREGHHYKTLHMLGQLNSKVVAYI